MPDQIGGEAFNTDTGALTSNLLQSAGVTAPPAAESVGVLKPQGEQFSPGQAIPPVSAEDKAQRKSGWTQFLQKLSSDPALQAGLLKIGTQLLQPIQPGQTGGGAAASAIQSGADTISAARSGQARGALEERKVGAAETRAKAAMISAKKPSGTSKVAKVEEVNQMAKALVQAKVYPDTPQGRAQAKIKARGLISSGKDMRLESMKIAVDAALPSESAEKIIARAKKIEKALKGGGPSSTLPPLPRNKADRVVGRYTLNGEEVYWDGEQLLGK